jgi:cytochrome P450
MSKSAANELEADPSKIAQHQNLLGLASNYTSKLALTNVFYDLCAHPEYTDELRQEVEECLLESGKWDMTTLAKMEKLESFMSESQRINPPNLSTYTSLSIALSKSRSSCMMGSIYLLTHLSPWRLHPFSWIPKLYRIRRSLTPGGLTSARQEPGEESKHRFAMTDKYPMQLGPGIHACPGRALALAIIKMVAAALLIAFDMQFPEGKRRPANMTCDEMVFPSPGTVMMKRRPIREGVPAIGVN